MLISSKEPVGVSGIVQSAALLESSTCRLRECGRVAGAACWRAVVGEAREPKAWI